MNKSVIRLKCFFGLLSVIISVIFCTLICYIEFNVSQTKLLSDYPLPKYVGLCRRVYPYFFLNIFIFSLIAFIIYKAGFSSLKYLLFEISFILNILMVFFTFYCIYVLNASFSEVIK